MPGTFSPPPQVGDPDKHHGTCVTHVPWCMPGSITSGFLWSRWRGKHFRHSRRMRIPQLSVSGKRPIDSALACERTAITECSDFTIADICGSHLIVISQTNSQDIDNKIVIIVIKISCWQRVAYPVSNQLRLDMTTEIHVRWESKTTDWRKSVSNWLCTVRKHIHRISLTPKSLTFKSLNVVHSISVNLYRINPDGGEAHFMNNTDWFIGMHTFSSPITKFVEFVSLFLMDIRAHEDKRVRNMECQHTKCVYRRHYLSPMWPMHVLCHVHVSTSSSCILDSGFIAVVHRTYLLPH